jgi:hypothetical protein
MFKFKRFNRRSLVIIAALVLMIIIGLVVWLVSRPETSLPAVESPTGGQSLPAPEFLDDAAKLDIGLPPETNVQVLRRGAAGQVTVYKVIKSEADIVVDPSQIGPLSPRQPTIEPTAE